MNSLILINFLEQQAKGNKKLQNLLAQVAQCLMRKEELSNQENELQQEVLMNTMEGYDLECIAKQLKSQQQQQCAAEAQMQSTYKHAVEFCVQVHNIDWHSQFQCKLELMQLQCQNEMRELSAEYEEERERRKALEQRPIVQKVRAAEKKVADIQTKIDNAKERAVAYQKKILAQIEKLKTERNAIIVYLVKGSKDIADKEKELAALESANIAQTEDLIAKKEELISKMQKLNAKLPVFTNANELETSQEKTCTNIDFTPSIVTKLEAFPNFGNTINANTEVQPKEIRFLDLFKEWELKEQQQFQQLATTTAYTGFTSIYTSDIIVNTTTTDHLTTMPDSGLKSILQREIISESLDDAAIPKKRVRFATSESVNCDLDVNPSSHTDFNVYESVNIVAKDEEIDNATFIVERNMPSLIGDTETIEIFSTDEVMANENKQVHSEQPSSQKFKKPHFVTAKKLLRKAKLQGSQRKSKVQANSSTVVKQPKIEIQECRIIKPADTKLPTKLPIVLTPEQQVQSTNTQIPLETLQTNKNKMFKVPPIPKMRKRQQMPECNNLFDDFLKESSEESSPTDSKSGSSHVKAANVMLSFDESLAACEKSKRKCKKSALDFDNFFRETLKNCNENSTAMQMSPAVDDNDSSQFDLNFDENNNLSHNKYEDLFVDQANTGKDDDLLSFDFSDC